MAFSWLGQAGFVLRFAERLILIDPYLSNSLARKYKGTRFPHIRMMPPPIAPEALRNVDWVLCTHAHTDHMDPETLSVLTRNTACRFLIPAAETAHARDKTGLPEERTTPIDAGQFLALTPEIEAQAVASAHEELRIDEKGRHHFLGYLLRLGVFTLYHAGDCAPYEGLAATLRELHIDLALLPVNGRDAHRSGHGIPGNFHLEEAAELCAGAGIPQMLAHHFGMFDFNTVDPVELKRKAETIPAPPRILVPEINKAFILNSAVER